MAECSLGQDEPERESAASELNISIVGARGLWPSDWQPGEREPACYCEVTANGDVLLSTAMSESGCEPVWAAAVDVSLAGAALEFAVYRQCHDGRGFLGKAHLETKDYATDGFNGELKLKEAKTDEARIRVKVKLAGKDLPAGPAASFRVRVERPSAGTPWAAVFDDRDGVQLQVKDIANGAISEHNSRAKPQQRIDVGDFVMEANGLFGNARSMLAEFKTKCSVDCVISRSVTCTFLVDFGEASVPKGIDMIASSEADSWVIKSIADNGKGQGQLQPGDRIVAIGSVRAPAADPQKVREATTGKALVTVRRSAAGNGKGSPPHWAFE
eukprot:CAMPEP_0175646504 /NCGR_PEP_ID=MMETSP0097-20121207/7355_1 /TAXON_ID=311494 /ORGANISM="Alexandrium monilatum, Strain CCMP3105" /LENGTH=327 /DNA_ID=CAMNT_0016952403 /DNA_START=18 /DNA_END=1001 /DNA_ORIENTATION=-